MDCLFQNLAGGVKHPDSMTRADKLKMISSFESDADAMIWWLKYAPRISRKAFNEARG